MPYIKQEDRARFNSVSHIEDLKSPGELNYIITLLCLAYIDQHGFNYATLNEVVGVLECAKLELYRRHVAPYEDIKIQENGDVV